MKVSFFQGQTPARADLAILALMYSTWLTFPVRLPTLELSCQVSGSLLPVLQAVLSCTQSAARFPTLTLLCWGVFLDCYFHRNTEAKFGGSGCLLEAATSYWLWNKDSNSQGEFKGREVKKKKRFI